MQDGRTPLFIAAQEGHLEVAQVLLAAGSNTQAKHMVRGEGERKGGDMGSGGVRCTNGTVCCFLGFLRMKGLVNRLLFENVRNYTGTSCKT